MRIGHGYDVHKLARGRRLILCGEEIPNDVGLLGHSDADAALHALMDAMLGAAAMGDIGAHFPDSDARWEGASSLEMLGQVRDMLEAKGYGLVNADITIIAQRPKLAPYIEAMRGNIARALAVDTDAVSVKATTEERLGFTGREEGIAAHAVVLIEKL